MTDATFDADRWAGDVAGTAAAQHGDRLALVDDASGDEISFEGLDVRARRVAGRLRGLGVGPGDRVAALSENRLELVDLLFACGKVGATLVPLNWRLAAPELADMVRRTGPRVLFASKQRRDLAVEAVGAAGETAPPIEALGGDGWAGDRADPLEGGAPADVGPEDPALVLFTGGTTGTPKGAVLPWRAIVANAQNTVRGWGLSPDDVTPLVFPTFHTGGWNVTTLPFLLLGATTVLMEGFDAGRLLEVVEERSCTLVVGVPTMFHAVADHPRFDGADLSSVREFISGGAPCPVPLMERYWRRGLAFKVGYGLTEAGPNNFVIDPEVAKAKPTSVGRPVPGVEVRIVDPDTGEDVPPGEAGELVLRGDHVFAGYLDDPDATRDAFLGPSPADGPDAPRGADGGWLRTGDVALVDADGDHFIVDRLKEMYISGGENVYPVEVEQVLAEHPDVDLVAVLGVPDATWGEVGLAVVRPVDGAAAGLDEAAFADALRAFAAERLAKYKVPKHVRVVEEMPLSGAGKVLKKELRSRFEDVQDATDHDA